MISNVLPLSTGTYSNIYLEPAILMSILGTADYYDLSFNWLIQYAQTNYNGNLIYKNGYVRVFDEFTLPGNLYNYFHIDYLSDQCDYSIESMIEKIDNNKYVILELDEFYVPGMYFYIRSHYYRKFLIYGYDLKDKTVAVYTHNKDTRYVSMKIDFSLFTYLNDLRNTSGNKINCDWLCGKAVSLNNTYNENSYDFETLCSRYIDQHEVMHTDQYNTPIYKRSYGAMIYDVIEDALLKKDENLELIDYRCFSMLSFNKMKIYELLNEQADKRGQTELSIIAGEYKNLSKKIKYLTYYLIKEFGGNINMQEMILNIRSIRNDDLVLFNSVIKEINRQ